MKKFILAILFSGCASFLFAQSNTELKLKEDTLKLLSDSMFHAFDQDDRKQAGYAFIKTMASTLRIPGSFDYKFDSLKHISFLYPPEKEFRILTWYVPLDAGTQRYYGVIQMNDKSKNTFFPLIDFSEFMNHEDDTVTNNMRWFGAIYYRLIEHTSGNKKYYTLLGFNGNDYRSNKKVMEILSFDENKPVFGAPLFDFGKNAARDSVRRFIIEYKESATTTLNLDPDLNMIIFDHLTPEDPSTADLKYTYVPDGTYEGFIWKDGKWNYIENVFTSTQKTPFPNPIDFKQQDDQFIPKDH